ncbi:glycoprotein [Tsukamurella sp. M9C]|uniref:glycoprotein n=1 Tax=Tsukamurella sp. M9C TaxID=2877520 RepID=UPI001CCA5CAD|nr:glycoprotein [Tsukamurella sp. M9C]MCA0154598.1 glycoprotein [Tsukamurella sp. M9C]
MTRSARLLCVLTLLIAITGLPAPSGAGLPDAQFVRINVDEVTSRITDTSPNEVVVRGTVENFGDRDVSDLDLRIQRAPAVSTSAQLRSDLVADNNVYDTLGRFEPVSKVLKPGEKTSFNVAIPVRPSPTTRGATLGIDRPGVYPLLLNLNGKPAYGGAARLDDSRTLLPVLGLPDGSADTPGGVDKAVTTSPAQVTLLWPLADNPKLAGGVPGGGDTPVRLVDDALAGSLGEGGRLDGLLSAYEDATRGPDPRRTALRTAACLAIDPDLLVTVQAMTAPYRVSRNPADPRGPSTAGTGSDEASAWLEKLRRVAADSCVVALPFGQVDLEALGRSAEPSLQRAALDTPSDVIDSILGVQSVRGVAIPTSGVLLSDGARQLRASDVAATVVSATAVRAPDRGAGTPSGIVPVGQGIGAAVFDPSVSAALAAMGRTTDGAEDGVAPGPTGTVPTSSTFTMSEESAAMRRQAAVGAVTAAALDPTQRYAPPDGWAASTATDPVARVTGRSTLIVPPQVWAAGPDDARAVLDAVSAQFGAGLAGPRTFRDVVASAQSTGRDPARNAAPWTLRQPPETTASRVPDRIVTAAAAHVRQVDQLGAALLPLPKTPLTPRMYTSPLREDAVRALRWAPSRQAVDGDASIRLTAARASMSAQLASVRFVSPGGAYTLASDKSPLLIVARNDLPLPIRTVIDWSAPQGVTIDASEVQELPARGTRQIELPTTVDYSRQISVQLTLRSSSNMPLGDPISVSVHSNAYGQSLFWITCGVGILLVLLAGRRLWRRFRGRPDPADADRPPADEHEKRIANSYAAHRPTASHENPEPKDT